MNFWKEHFELMLLAVLAILSATAGVLCDVHHVADASKWLYGQAGGFTGALMLRMNSQRPQIPNVPGQEAPKV
jgi:hypothetical protein